MSTDIESEDTIRQLYGLTTTEKGRNLLVLMVKQMGFEALTNEALAKLARLHRSQEEGDKREAISLRVR